MGTVSKKRRTNKKHSGKPVSAGIHRAAKRAGIEPTEPVVDIPARELAALREVAEAAEQAADEVEDLREVLEAAESIYQCEGYVGPDSVEILHEGLRAAYEDIEMLDAGSHTGSGAMNSMAFVRAQYRINLAIALSDYRAKYPRPKPKPLPEGIELPPAEEAP